MIQLVLGPPPLPRSRATGRRHLLMPGAALVLAGYAVAMVAVTYRPLKPADAEPRPGLVVPTASDSVELDWGGEAFAAEWNPTDLSAKQAAALGAQPPGDEQRGHWWLRRASTAYHRGRLPAALEAYQHARELLPTTPLPCLRAARLALALERPAEAIELAECARDRAPDHPLPYLYLGAAHQLAGHTDAAAHAYFQFAARAPGHPRTGEAEKVGARLLVEIGNERPTDNDQSVE